jgi:mannose-6-phosphate isomerase-like protein (cupin superfamily)
MPDATLPFPLGSVTIDALCLERFEVCGDITTFLITQQASNGMCFMCEILSPYREGVAMPPHVHPDEDQAYHVLEGELSYIVGEQTGTIGPGKTLLIPRGTSHRVWTHGPTHARTLMLSMPGNLERVYRELGRPVQTAEPDLNLTVDEMSDIARHVFAMRSELVVRPAS